MKRIVLGQPKQWSTHHIYMYDNGRDVDVISEVYDNITGEREWLDSKFDALYRKKIWSRDDQILHEQESVLKSFGHCPAQVIIFECDEDEFLNLRQ